MHLHHRLVLFCAFLAAILAHTADVKTAGPRAEKQCLNLASSYQTSTGLDINNTFSQYFAEGAMPSLELLTALYPAGTIPPGTNLASILSGLGPDIDIKSDAGYGRSNTRAAQNGPTGGMPAFCRFGAYIKTSPLTIVLMEVWMPLASDPNIPLAAVNASDFPTNTTSPLVNKDGTLKRAPLYVTKGQFTLPKPAPGSSDPPAPNDIPEAPSKAKPESSSMTQSGTTETVTPQTVAGPPPSPRSTHGDKDKCKDPDRDALKGQQVLGDKPGWNGRLVFVGDGGQRGYIPFPDLKQVISRYRFAAVGSNMGHYSNTNGVTWVNGSQFNETLLDYGSRGNHVSLLLAEDVLDHFYGKKAGVRVPKDGNRLRRYYLGSSNGAGRGMSSVQVYPKDFHGVLLGPPSVGFMDMNVGQIHTQRTHVKKIVGAGWFTQGALHGPIRKVVVQQCDELDGVKDGIISDPFSCKPNLESELLCGGTGKYSGSNGTCLTQAQIDNAYNLYKDTYIDGKFVYPRYLPGLEDSAGTLTGSSIKASGWTQLVVYKKPQLDSAFDQYNNITYDALQAGKREDPGGVNADETDLSPFVQWGGKLMVYHGTYDLVISPMATINYLNKVFKVTTGKVHSAIKFYLIPGMQHSRGGPGPINFGGITQRDAGNRPLEYDTDHDMILALVAWTEKSREPAAQVGATYQRRSTIIPSQDTGGSSTDIDLPIPDVYQNYNWGVVDTRLLCPYPQKAIYKSGATAGRHGHKAFRCH